jgi:hypothetical protein
LRRLAALVAAALLLGTITYRTPDSKVEAAYAEVPADPPRATTSTTSTVPPTTTTTTLPPTTTTQPPPTTVPPPPPQPSPRPSSGGCGGWEPVILAHFPADQLAKACQVFGCETGWTFDPTIHNPSSSASGAAQFLDSTWTSTTGLAPPAAAYPLDTQIAAAAALWRSSGWSPWSCA